MSAVLQEIISLLTSGIAQMATGIGNGLKALIEAIFVETTTGGDVQLTTFAGVVVVFAGISLAVGLSRWVVSFITSLGARN